MNAPVETIVVKRDEAGLRLDRWFRVHFPDVTYGYLQKLLRSGQVRVDSKRVQANARLEAGQQVRVPAVVRQPPKAEPVAGAAARSFQGRPRFHRAHDPVRGRGTCWC